MRVIEARFHPQKKTGTAIIIVGRVLFDRGRAWVEGAPANGRGGVEAPDTGAMVEKLRFLVASSGPQPCDKLLGLTSEFWSFLEIDASRSS